MSATTTTRDYERVARAIRFLEVHADEGPSLADVAAHVGTSPYHFQRLFGRYAGTTPKRFLQYVRAAHARACLRDARSVLDATLDAGLSSTSRLHDLLVTVTAMTPGEVRRRGAGLTIRHGVHDTPFGRARIGVTDRGIVGLAFLDAGEDEEGPGSLASDWPRATCVHAPDATRPFIARAFQRLGQADAPLPVLVRGTNLQLRVWDALLHIPAGCVTSYGSLAGALGMPSGARAVAGAVAANRVAYLIPCHRVLRATGAIGGYRWGTDRKRAMLGRELAPSDDSVTQMRKGPSARTPNASRAATSSADS